MYSLVAESFVGPQRAGQNLGPMGSRERRGPLLSYFCKDCRVWK